jgi:hypothetical protein
VGAIPRVRACKEFLLEEYFSKRSLVVTGCWPYLKFQPYASDVPALFRVLNGCIRIKIVEQPLLVEAV